MTPVYYKGGGLKAIGGAITLEAVLIMATTCGKPGLLVVQALIVGMARTGPLCVACETNDQLIISCSLSERAGVAYQ